MEFSRVSLTQKFRFSIATLHSYLAHKTLKILTLAHGLDTEKMEETATKHTPTTDLKALDSDHHLDTYAGDITCPNHRPQGSG